MSKSSIWKSAPYALLFTTVMLASACATTETQTPTVKTDTVQATEQTTEQVSEPVPDEVETTNAVLRTATIYVKNWDASIRFYTKYMAYGLLVELPVTAEKSLKTLGAKNTDTARIAYLKPKNSLIQRPFAGNYLAIIEIKGDGREDLQYTRASDPTVAMAGEIVLAHQVVGVDDMFAAMQADEDVIIVAPLSLSGAGKSRSFSVIDPNGVRVEIYEYIPGEEPVNNP